MVAYSTYHQRLSLLDAQLNSVGVQTMSKYHALATVAICLGLASATTTAGSLVSDGDLDLDSYVTDKAIDGLIGTAQCPVCARICSSSASYKLISTMCNQPFTQRTPWYAPVIRAVTTGHALKVTLSIRLYVASTCG